MVDNIKLAALKIVEAKKISAFTGAGISVESGIPPFRGPEGLWSKYDPRSLDLNYYFSNTADSWKVIKKIFYEFFGKAKPNRAHIVLGEMEKDGVLSAVITQNIDNLHQVAGTKNIFEFHGNSQKFVCTSCSEHFDVGEIEINETPPACNTCGSLLKPDFIFFGEGIPEVAYQGSVDIANTCDIMIVIGSTGEVMPACHIPIIAKRNGATIIEINPLPSNFTNSITDIFLQGKAGDIMGKLYKEIHHLKK